MFLTVTRNRIPICQRSCAHVASSVTALTGST